MGPLYRILYMLKISVLFLLISTNSYALNRLPRAENELDTRLLNRINLAIKNINHEKILFCEDLDRNTNGPSFKNCSHQNIDLLKKKQFSAYIMIENWLKEMEKYETNFQGPMVEVDKKRFGGKMRMVYRESSLAAPLKLLKCISNNIKGTSFECNSNHKLCRKGAYAITETLSPLIKPFLPDSEIQLCSSFWRNENSEVGTIIHEIAHHCGAVDADFFNSKSDPPRDSNGVDWHLIADTYEYWAEFGFCVPYVDC